MICSVRSSKDSHRLLESNNSAGTKFGDIAQQYAELLHLWQPLAKLSLTSSKYLD
jgi:hypothetical protein